MPISTDLSLFPISTTINDRGFLAVAGHDLADLARQYATPLYLYDGATFRQQLDRLNKLLKLYYPGEGLVAYAAKAYFSRVFAARVAALGIGVDTASLGEMSTAQSAGFRAQSIHLHGNNKSEQELRAALEWNIHTIVVDNLDELTLLESLAAARKQPARIWLRITPDINVATHRHIQTSHPSSKFGLHLQNGEAVEAINRAVTSPWLKLTGLHSHLGSQLRDPEVYRQAIKLMLEAASASHFIPEEVSPGGGWGVRYTNTDPLDDAEPWVRVVAETLQDGCTGYGWPLPRLVLEPGRWLAARAGVAVYSLGAQKNTPGGAHLVAVDGGMADNPRAALYQAEYSACVVQKPLAEPEVKTTIVGKYCESGDVLIHEILLPPVTRGDLLAVPVSGAYQLSMASNYNYAPRPAVIWLEEGSIEVLQTREQPELSGWLASGENVSG